MRPMPSLPKDAEPAHGLNGYMPASQTHLSPVLSPAPFVAARSGRCRQSSTSVHLRGSSSVSHSALLSRLILASGDTRKPRGCPLARSRRYSLTPRGTMQILRVILFTHVAAAIGLFVALALEWVVLMGLRRALSYEQARLWAGEWSLVTAVGGPSFLVVLASGVYLAKSLGASQLGWVRVALPALVVVAIAGSVVRSRRQRLRSAITASSGPLLPGLLAELRKPLLLGSLRLRTALLVGLVFR